MKQIKVIKIHLPIGKKNAIWSKNLFLIWASRRASKCSGKNFFKLKTQRYKSGTIHKLRQQKIWGMYQKKPQIMQLWYTPCLVYISWLYWKYSLKYSLLTSILGNRSGVSRGEKNGNPYEVLHDPVLVKYKTYLMLLVQNTIRFIPKCGRLELGENFREHKAKRLDCSCQGR